MPSDLGIYLRVVHTYPSIHSGQFCFECSIILYQMNFKFNNSFIFKDRRTKRKLKGEEDKRKWRRRKLRYKSNSKRNKKNKK